MTGRDASAGSPGMRQGPPPALPLPPDFPDRVMALVAAEPLPSLAGAFARSLVRLRIGDARAVLGTAWRLAFERARPVLPLVRLQSLLLVLLLGVLLSVGAVLAAGGTLRVIEEVQPSPADQRQGPAVVEIGPRASPTPAAYRLVRPSDVPEAAGRTPQEGRADRGSQPAARREGSEPGPAVEPRLADEPRHQQADAQQDGGQRGVQRTTPRAGSAEQAETRRQTPAPDGRRPQASAEPDGAAGQTPASPRARNGSRSGG